MTGRASSNAAGRFRVATAPWTFERRSVDPKLEEGSSVAIRSGVKAGEQVVVKGGILLND